MAIALVAIGWVAAIPSPATAAQTLVCSGRDYRCDKTGYAAHANRSHWTMAAGHNCTNYVAHRMIRAGMSPRVSWLHNAYEWAREARARGFRVDSTPAVGAVAQWDSGAGGVSRAGHVAYIEAVSTKSILVAEDNYPWGPMSQRRITRGDPAWPSHIIHFVDAPTPAAALPPPSRAAIPAPAFDTTRWILGTLRDV